MNHKYAAGVAKFKLARARERLCQIQYVADSHRNYVLDHRVHTSELEFVDHILEVVDKALLELDKKEDGE